MKFHIAFTLLAAVALGSCSSAPQRPAAPAAVVQQTLPMPELQTGPQSNPRWAQLRRLQQRAPTLNAGVLALALEARACAIGGGGQGIGERLAVIDYSLPSTAKRLWVFDLASETLLYHEHVTHGQGSGENFATNFSNIEGSYQTSLGLYRTAETYIGANGYSLRLDGLDKGFNDAARQRAIVMHGAWYAEPELIAKQGRLGRSQGCPALRHGIARQVIDDLKQAQLLFAYAEHDEWLRSSRYFSCRTGVDAQRIIADARRMMEGGLPIHTVAAL
ncbi:MAG: murein L,D-transpeptidase catalytic domain family protein [Pseudomonadota bacterium]|nr:murein L,D-transpeptidase catalytic domain family protein [Pseudomonadota bacterium]